MTRLSSEPTNWLYCPTESARDLPSAPHVTAMVANRSCTCRPASSTSRAWSAMAACCHAQDTLRSVAIKVVGGGDHDLAVESRLEQFGAFAQGDSEHVLSRQEHDHELGRPHGFPVLLAGQSRDVIRDRGGMPGADLLVAEIRVEERVE
jgi:hypothetical protein